jgi:hypothetical protein
MFGWRVVRGHTTPRSLNDVVAGLLVPVDAGWFSVAGILGKADHNRKL